MAKISEEALVKVLLTVRAENGKTLTPKQVTQIIYAAKEEEKQNAPAKKPKDTEDPEYIFVISDPTGKLMNNVEGWLIKKVPGNLDANLEYNPDASVIWSYQDLPKLLGKIKDMFNSNGKFIKKNGNLNTLGDLFEFGTKSKMKNMGIVLVNKIPAVVMNGTAVFDETKVCSNSFKVVSTPKYK